MAYFLKITDSRHCMELSELASAAYRAAGSSREIGEDALKKLWQRKENRDLRKNWQAILMKARIARFRPPKIRELARLASTPPSANTTDK